jgi:hypothetical protein
MGGIGVSQNSRTLRYSATDFQIFPGDNQGINLSKMNRTPDTDHKRDFKFNEVC